jgi:hypothetical protein
MQKALLVTLILLFAACGANDQKNEAENYPTYDTSDVPLHVNDSTASQDMQGEGGLRHNIDSDGDEDRDH